MSPRNNHRKLLLPFYAYHEAGHAVVWHALGGLIEEVSIASSSDGYKGYCRFGPLIRETEEQGDWATQLAASRRNPEMIIALYAGMLSLAYYCASYGGEEDYLEGSERDDLEKIDSLLLLLCSDENQRATLKDTCWHQAQKLLSEYRFAVQALATKLLKCRTLDGKEAHQIIWKITEYPEQDWRFQVLCLSQR